MISIRNYNRNIHRSYRMFIGRKVAQVARDKKVIYERIYNENHYPKEFLDFYFLENPVPEKNENCLSITLEMINQLPIQMLFKPENNDNLSSDGFNVFLGDKCIGFWK